MQLSYRRAMLADKAMLLELMAAYYAFDGHHFDAAKSSAVLDEFLADDRFGLAWLIEVDGAIAGYMALCIGFSLEFGGRDAFVDELYLYEPYRGQGLGRAALAHMIAEARRLGIKALHLEVAEDNARARRLYEALGFELRARFQLMSSSL